MRRRSVQILVGLIGLGGLSLFLWARGADESFTRALAEIGYAEAQYQMGRSAKDRLAAVYWFRLAADKEHDEAQYRLGLAYQQGLIGLTGSGHADFVKAGFWYHKAAAQNHRVAQYRLAQFYREGLGVQQNESRAADYALAAAQQGCAPAQWSYGLWLREGDKLKARQWFEKAASQGHGAALARLGQLDAARNIQNEAYIWYALAVRFGYRRAAARRDELLAQLTPSELTRARIMIQSRFEAISKIRQSRRGESDQ